MSKRAGAACHSDALRCKVHVLDCCHSITRRIGAISEIRGHYYAFAIRTPFRLCVGPILTGRSVGAGDLA